MFMKDSETKIKVSSPWGAIKVPSLGGANSEDHKPSINALTNVIVKEAKLNALEKKQDFREAQREQKNLAELDKRNADLLSELEARRKAKLSEKLAKLEEVTKKRAEKEAEKARIDAQRRAELTEACDQAFYILSDKDNISDSDMNKIRDLSKIDDNNVLDKMVLSMMTEVYNICKKQEPEWLRDLFPVAKTQVSSSYSSSSYSSSSSSSSAYTPSPNTSAPKQGSPKEERFPTQKKNESKSKEDKKKSDADPQGTFIKNLKTCGGLFNVTYNTRGEIIQVKASKFDMDTGSTSLVVQKCHSLGGFRCNEGTCKENHYCTNYCTNYSYCNCRAFRACSYRDCNGTNPKTKKSCGHWHLHLHGDWGKRKCDM
jgi:hypothetical protein